MFKKLKKFIEKSVFVEPFDPSRFNDSIAMQTEWTAAKSGGSNFHSHKLIRDNYNRIKFRSTLTAKMFSSVFIILGAVVPGMIMLNPDPSGDPLSLFDHIMLTGIGLIFMGVGGFLIYIYAKPIVFDKLNGYYWKGWSEPSLTAGRQSAKNCTRLRNIHAIQLLSEYIQSDKNSYYSYEINLVLKDGSRLNVIDHGNVDEVQRDAKILSDFLDKPVWDAIR